MTRNTNFSQLCSITEDKFHGQKNPPNLLIPTQARPKIVVIGSLHMDLTARTGKIPSIGETVLSEHFSMSPGGKGANQAVAAARLGANVILVGRVGSDEFGGELIGTMKRNRVNTSYVVEDREMATGVALIMVDDRGNNIIAVASGADVKCCREDIDRAEKVIKSSNILSIQLELPLRVVEHAIDKAFREKIKVILNPSPGRQLPDELLRKIYVLTPNEREAEIISGCRLTNVRMAKAIAQRIRRRGVENVIITMGRNGAVMATEKETVHMKGMKVDTVDATGAGDAFCGTLAVAISSGMELKEAVLYSNCAGALATTRIGAQDALPNASELRRFMKNRGLI